MFATVQSKRPRTNLLNRMLRCIAVAQVCGCIVGPGGGFESLSGGTGTTSAEETGFPPDEVECDYELGGNPLGQSECEEDEDCCVLPSPLLDFACPSDQFPNNWACEAGVCRQRSSPTAQEGCSPQSDDCIVPGFTCVEI